MLTPAFSTVACPEWTLDRVALAAQRLGFSAVELRTFGVDSRRFACDPALTDAAKVRRLFAEAGVSICSLATDIVFDAPVNPPIIGHLIADQETAVRAAQRAVDLATSIECPFVRVFGFRLSQNEQGGNGRTNGVARICDRLGKVLDHALKTGVKVAFENGGSFATSSQVAEILSHFRSPLLVASYNAAAAQLAGENPAEGVTRLTADGGLGLLRVKDIKDGRPVVLGTGEIAVRDAVVTAARTSGSASIPVVFEWDRAWIPDIGEADFALDHAARTLWQWAGSGAPAPAARAPIPASAY
ncbi:MAG: TIM barrel protein [Phycisphaerales bacterium]|nr:TIM barrel protein [Phycisphaerales bacterium]